MTVLDDVRALMSEAIQRGRTRVRDLNAELEAGSGRGSALPRLAMRELADGVLSVAESWARETVRGTKLPQPMWNATVFTADGELLGTPDGWFDDVALAWEIDSFDWHFDAKGYARTIARNTRYAGAGIAVVQTLPSRLREDPSGVIAELRAAYDAAKARPRPPVRAKIMPT